MQTSPFQADHEGRILAAILDCSDDAILVMTLDGTIVTWNPAAERMYGYSAHEVLGRPISFFIPSEQSHELDEMLGGIRAGQRIGNRETRRQTKDGRVLDVLLSISPIENSARQVVGACTIARDITERKRVEQALSGSEARWRSIIESAVDGIVVIDARGKVEAFNERRNAVALGTRLREQSALTRLGEMAAVVAHEVKNPLTGIRGAIQVIGSRLPAGSKDIHIVGDIVARIDALNDLMKDLLLFARPPQPRMAPVDVLSLLKNV